MTSGQQDWTLGVSILAQELANLTATVSATALDIRALNEGDLPHEPLPYELEILAKDDWSINNGAYGLKTYGQADWGSGLDFFPVMFACHIVDTDPIFEKMSTGLEIYLYESADTVPRWGKTYTVHAGNLPMIRYNGTRRVLITEPIRGLRLDAGSNESLQVLIYNYSGYTIAPDTVISYFAK